MLPLSPSTAIPSKHKAAATRSSPWRGCAYLPRRRWRRRRKTSNRYHYLASATTAQHTLQRRLPSAERHGGTLVGAALPALSKPWHAWKGCAMGERAHSLFFTHRRHYNRGCSIPAHARGSSRATRSAATHLSAYLSLPRSSSRRASYMTLPRYSPQSCLLFCCTGWRHMCACYRQAPTRWAGSMHYPLSRYC